MKTLPGKPQLVLDKIARTMGFLGAVFTGLAFLQNALLPGLFLLWLGASFGFVALAFALDKPTLLGKRRDGKLNLLSRVFLWPYHALSGLAMKLFRRFSRGNLWDEIAPNLFLGARLSEKEARKLAPRIETVIDLCAELPEAKGLRERGYLSFPTLDTRAPKNLPSLARQIQNARENGGVFVHCAAGRGRSVTVVCAVLLLSGEAETIEEAREIVRKKRPMEFHRAQEQALHEWAREIEAGV